MKPVFISGPHGSGKTTLINKLQKKLPDFFIENTFDIDFLSRFPSFSVLNHFERCLIRLYHRIFLCDYNTKHATNIPNKTILVSRSIYDSVAYIKTYRELGIISDEDFLSLSTIYKNISITPNVIILNPDVEIITERLRKRRLTHERENRDKIFAFEDTTEFLRIMHYIFEQMKDYDNVQYITNNNDDDITKIIEWIEKINR